MSTHRQFRSQQSPTSTLPDSELKPGAGQRHWFDIQGWFDFADLYDDVAAKAGDGARIVEVGCWLGRSVAYLATKLREFGKHPEIVCVDTWRGDGSERLYAEKVRNEGGSVYEVFRKNMRDCEVLDMLTLVPGESVESANGLPDEYFDFIFIDAGHDYESVKRDIAAWLPKLKPGGRLCGHDFDLPEVIRAVTEMLEVKAISSTSWEMIRPRAASVACHPPRDAAHPALRSMMHIADMNGYYVQGYDRVFAVVCDANYFTGLWALLNSIYAYHGARYPVFVFCRDLTPQQKARMGDHPLLIKIREIAEFPFPSPGAWEAKQQVFAALMPEARCVYLLDADLVLTSKVDEIFALAERGGIVSSRDGGDVHFDEEYSRYDPALVGKNHDYVNSGNVCLDSRKHWSLGALWAFAAGYGSYSPGGGEPLRLPGYGDQGSFNALLTLTGAEKDLHPLPEEEWCSCQRHSELKIEAHDPSGRLRVRNQTTGGVQRLVHSSGPKWWTEEGRARFSLDGDKGRCFEHFSSLIPFSPPPAATLQESARLLIGVCSCAGNAKRREACRNTWMKDLPPFVKVVFFAGEGCAEEPDLWILECDDGRDSQSTKVQAFMAKAIAEEEFDFLAKCDDDTYLVLDRLQSVVAGTPAGFVGDPSLEADGRHAIGGAGYFVRRDLVKNFSHAPVPALRCEDAVFSWWARELGFAVRSDDRLRADHGTLPNAANDLVSVHGSSAADMAQIDACFFPDKDEEWFVATHPDWDGVLILSPGGEFHRHGKQGEGSWELRENGSRLRLHWNDWPASRLVRTDRGFSDGQLVLERFHPKSARESTAELPRKIILRSHFSPGDIITLTAAVRDLHLSHPGRFETDVRTPFPELWENSPYLSPLKDSDPDAEEILCKYPLIDQANHLPYHMIHGFRLFLEEKLGVPIESHAFKGDIHLSDEEKSWLSQVEELEGQGTRFWIIANGGKQDFTAKWWDPARAQAVVDHFAGRIRFVQCGASDHHHPPLQNVINLVGRTSMRQMVRLMHHADGVICPVTMFMHLAAAVETKPGRPANRPCVVIAGGREPAHWEAYPHHQFLHTMGALPCCENGGCWKSRVEPLGDGAEQDKSLCQLPVTLPGGRKLPKCLDMITADHVIRAVETYLQFDSMPRGTQVRFNADS